MTSRPVYLAVCAACSAYPSASIWATDVPQSSPFYCPACQLGLLTGEEQLAQPHPIVSFVDGRAGARWCVLEILGDGRFLTRPLGLPDFPVAERHVNEIRPAFSYEKLERAKRDRTRKKATVDEQV
jgi:hypothetical protein